MFFGWRAVKVVRNRLEDEKINSRGLLSPRCYKCLRKKCVCKDAKN